MSSRRPYSGDYASKPLCSPEKAGKHAGVLLDLQLSLYSYEMTMAKNIFAQLHALAVMVLQLIEYFAIRMWQSAPTAYPPGQVASSPMWNRNYSWRTATDIVLYSHTETNL